MSRLKIKDPMRKKKTKLQKISLSKMAQEHLQIARNKNKEKDDDEIEKLIEKNILKKDGSYKHIKNVAKDLDWSTSRVIRSMDRLALYAAIQEKIKKRIMEETKKLGVKENKDDIKG